MALVKVMKTVGTALRTALAPQDRPAKTTHAPPFKTVAMGLVKPQKAKTAPLAPLTVAVPQVRLAKTTLVPQ